MSSVNMMHNINAVRRKTETPSVQRANRGKMKDKDTANKIVIGLFELTCFSAAEPC